MPIRRALRSTTLRSALSLSVGAVLAQAITVGSSPVLARLYSAEAFGEIALVTAVVALLASLSTGRYEMALPLTSRPDERRYLVEIALLLAVISALVTTVGLVLVVVLPYAPGWYRPALWYVPAGLVLTSVTYVGLYTSLGRTGNKRISAARVVTAASTFGLKLAAAATGLATATSLIVATLVGQALGLTLLFGGIARLFRSGRGVRESDLSRREVARRYDRFPRYAAPDALLTMLSMQMPIFLIAGIFDAESVGLYFLAHRLTQLPMQLLGEGISKVSLETTPRRGEGTETFRYVDRATLYLIAASAPILLGVMVGGGDLFALVLGDRWRASGEMARWLAPWAVSALTLTPLQGVAVARGLQAALLRWTLWRIIARGISLVTVAIVSGSLLHTVAAFGAAGFLSNIAMQISLRRSLRPVTGRDGPSAEVTIQLADGDAE